MWTQEHHPYLLHWLPVHLIIMRCWYSCWGEIWLWQKYDFSQYWNLVSNKTLPASLLNISQSINTNRQCVARLVYGIKINMVSVRRVPNWALVCKTSSLALPQGCVCAFAELCCVNSHLMEWVWLFSNPKSKGWNTEKITPAQILIKKVNFKAVVRFFLLIFLIKTARSNWLWVWKKMKGNFQEDSVVGQGS